MIDIESLAMAAMPTCPDDFGTARQVAAQNAFFDAVQATLPPDQFDTLEADNLQSNTEDMIREALRLLKGVRP